MKKPFVKGLVIAQDLTTRRIEIRLDSGSGVASFTLPKNKSFSQYRIGYKVSIPLAALNNINRSGN